MPDTVASGGIGNPRDKAGELRHIPQEGDTTMAVQVVPGNESHRIVAGLPFVEALARRLAASMPNSIDVGDLVQDGVLGLIDAAHRFDDGRGIKFETFAERRVRGAMIDALRRDAWRPRGPEAGTRP